MDGSGIRKEKVLFLSNCLAKRHDSSREFDKPHHIVRNSKECVLETIAVQEIPTRLG